MIETNDLIEEAKDAVKKACAPYSKVKVGVAVLTSKNKCYSAYTMNVDGSKTNKCAERVAMSKALDNNDKKITKLVIASSSKEFAYPCGVCRQMIYECANDAEIILVNKTGEMQNVTIGELLPFASKITK